MADDDVTQRKPTADPAGFDSSWRDSLGADQLDSRSPTDTVRMRDWTRYLGDNPNSLPAIRENLRSDLSTDSSSQNNAPLQGRTRVSTAVYNAAGYDELSQSGQLRVARKRIGVRRAAVLALFIGFLTVGVFHAFYTPWELDRQSAALNDSVTVQISVVDPELKDVPLELLAEQETMVQAAAFSPANLAQDTKINLPERSFVYSSEPRVLDQAGYSSTDAISKNGGRKPSRVAQIGLRPIPNSESRYISDNGVEWQGGWELNAPQANAERGTRYLDYLNKTFKKNMSGSLATQNSTGQSRILSTNQAPRHTPLKIKRYTK